MKLKKEKLYCLQGFTFSLQENKLKLDKIIGRGSYSVVYHSQKLAVKCQGVEVHSDEVEILRQIQPHPHIIEFIGERCLNDIRFIVMEYCESNLFEMVVKGVDMDHGCVLFDQLVQAVSYLHRQGVYHRDLKCENVLVKTKSMIKLADFGLATRQKISFDFGCGSPRYLAPENIQPRYDLDECKVGYDCEKNDVWSLVVILINILTKKNPWTRPHEHDLHFQSHFLTKRKRGNDSFKLAFRFNDQFCKVLRKGFDLDPRKRPKANEFGLMVKKLAKNFFISDTVY